MRLVTPSVFVRRERGLSLDQLYIIVAVALIALRPLLTPIPPYDFWWHLKFGQVIAQTGAIPTADSFSFTRAGEPFFDQSWLSQLVLYWLYNLGGVELIILIQAAVIATTYGLLLLLAIRRTGRVRLSTVLLLLAIVPISFDNWLVRPQSYTLPLFVAFLFILTSYRLGWGRRLWLLPLLMVVWVNLHGSFVLGLALIGIVAAGETLGGIFSGFKEQNLKFETEQAKLRSIAPLWLTLIVTALATLLNPRGIEVIGYVRNLLGSTAVTGLVTEWASPTPRTLSGALFFLFVIGLFLVLIYAQRRPVLTDLLLLLPFLWLALSAVRNVIWLAIVAYPLLVEALSSRQGPQRRGARGSPIMNAFLTGMVGLLVLLALPWIKPSLDLPPTLGRLISLDTPVDAVEALQGLPQEQRPERLFHMEGFGSYLIWAAPEQKVFIDPRIEFYPYEQWIDAIDLSQGCNVEELLAKYKIDGMLLSPMGQEPLLNRALQSGRWRVVYEDESAALLLPVQRP
ncbi:MAG: hypothetical protein KatS3mg057_0849 [Herpetosiphonaceae bacterium]|nr:MAG: hypothetical protein KatS3mg057_0849 [Herpetosiphonaceae bacterium]